MYDFQFKPFDEMTDEDYAAVGFKSGLEIHQQLFTEKKLFCRCPAGRYSDAYNAEILRAMRPTLSELGEYDGTALMEFKTKKEIIYQINYETVCTYEMDDTPPFELNEQALDIALEIAMLYGCSMVDEIHIARKQYLDGSIPTGFQRTTIVGVEGSIPYKDRRVQIIQLGLEEDACREVSDIGHRRVYITDRLGMPLIETVTGPDMRTPFEVAEVGEICRRLVRSTGKVRTGIGAGRQDVNVSVTGGTRIEIKGVPRIADIPMLTYNEAMRQWNLLRLREELHRRGITAETLETRTEDVTRAIRKTKFRPVAEAIERGLSVNAVVLKGFKGLLLWQTQTDTIFAREISDRVRVIACLTELPNIVHSDNATDTLTGSEWMLIRKQTGASEQDVVVIVWGSPGDIETAAKEIVIRAREATIGIPSETRQALDGGINGFERILPGPDRMYPDTDLPPKRITEERLTKLRAQIPVFYWERENWYRTLGIPADTIAPLAISRHADLFETAVKEWKLDPVLVSVALVQHMKRLRRRYKWRRDLSTEVMAGILAAVRDGLLTKDAVLAAMDAAYRSGGFDATALPAQVGETDAAAVIAGEAEKLARESVRYPHRTHEIITGRSLGQLRGRFDASQCASMVQRLLEEKH